MESQWAAILAKAVSSSGKGESAIRSRLPSSKSPWNSRSSDNKRRQHRRRPTGCRPPCGPADARSGPTPRGTRVATRAKKDSARAAPPPLRAASLMSRKSRVGERAHSFRLSLPRPSGLMGGGDDDAAFAAMARHQMRDQALAGCVQGGERLVQQPERPRPPKAAPAPAAASARRRDSGTASPPAAPGPPAPATRHIACCHTGWRRRRAARAPSIAA